MLIPSCVPHLLFVLLWPFGVRTIQTYWMHEPIFGVETGKLVQAAVSDVWCSDSTGNTWGCGAVALHSCRQILAEKHKADYVILICLCFGLWLYTVIGRHGPANWLKRFCWDETVLLRWNGSVEMNALRNRLRYYAYS